MDTPVHPLATPLSLMNDDDDDDDDDDWSGVCWNYRGLGGGDEERQEAD